MKKFILLLLLLPYVTFSQEDSFFEKPPVFPNCEASEIENLQNCFDANVLNHIYNTFKTPENVSEEKYSGEVVVLFEVDKEGAFKVVYVDAMYEELKKEATRVFEALPKIKPGTYNGKPTFKQYSIPIQIPIINQAVQKRSITKVDEELSIEETVKTEYDSVNKKLVPYTNKEYTSQLNIPFTHSAYAKFDRNINLVGTNSHTASKPFIYEDVSKYYDFKAENEALHKGKETLVSRKLWNEHMVRYQAENYWFTIDPIFDFEVGKDTDAEFSSTYNNTRGINIQGGLGKKFSFYASVFESQGRFAQYYNQYAESIKASDEVAIIPGRGIAKRFKADSYDYPVAEAYLSYSPTNFLNVQFGHGKNFIGDGYRSLFVSDVASPSPFLKINTKFWKIKYTNTWMWLKDVTPAGTDEDGAYLNKYMATHFLSWNATKRLNIGFFESIVWAKSQNRGFDVNYLNPIIFYRAIEFETGQDAGNAIMGLSAKYKVNDNINAYSQFVLDEFSLNDITGGEKSWKNKFGYQLGLKYYNAFKVNNLMLQAEYNRVRPYTYSHNTTFLNYGHNNQSMAHLWGANFSELVLIGRYHYKRWFANAKINLGNRGLDFDNNISYGNNIYETYNNRPSDTGITVGQGNKTKTFYTNLQAGYLINPATNLKIFADITIRDFNPEAQTSTAFKNNTVWFNFGIRTDLFNWYFDL
ncbi:gliding motility protein RemB [Oceanihabitans sp. 2_MG-2023]|uniref:energy transducer TonB n=1 Tax=Oceanihabitans sp. 2_MG-2023 TaxID=3062661 RepID=UPI0026E41F67|nr:gliding motility protein RemB [Oceanihabitans sp. 2_MG-2023]MDO6596352.1 gliding motility protein RemB [Oceanihabitans sp. 2_MG-2023]